MPEELEKKEEETQEEELVKSGSAQPQSIGVLSIIGTVIKLLPMIAKYLPIILGIIGGLTKFFDNFKPARDAVIDQESLAKLIEEITEREVTRIVNENKDRIRVWVPSEEDKQRQERLDELEEKLIKDQERHDKEKAAREEMERLRKEMEDSQG